MSNTSPRSAPTTSREFQLRRVSTSRRTSINDLDDDSLLHIFYLFRPDIFDRDESGDIMWNWLSERWWYKLVQVCRRWRGLILGSASHLRLSLLCTAGTPVAEMLAHSPPFPLTIDYDDTIHKLTAEDGEGITHALQHRDRVRCIYVRLPLLSLQGLISVMDDEFPALEFLHLEPPTKQDAHLTLSPAFEAPHLRYLELIHFTFPIPIGSELLSTAIGIVILLIEWIRPSAYPHPNNFLEQLLLLPQLEEMTISFCSTIPNREIERQLLDTPVTTHVTHSNLRLFDFLGVSAFLEAVLPHMITPLLDTFRVQFFNQLHFSVPHLPRFMMATERLRLSRVIFIFHHEAVVLLAYTHVGVRWSSVDVAVSCKHLDWQVTSVTQISKFLSPLFSEVVDLTLDYREHTLSSEWHSQADRTCWRELLGSFRNVKTLRVHNGLVGEVSRSLRPGGEPPAEILPELKELVCPMGSADDKTFTPFIHEREVAGHPVSLIGETFPVGRNHYVFFSSTGNTYIEPDPDPPP